MSDRKLSLNTLEEVSLNEAQQRHSSTQLSV